MRRWSMILAAGVALLAQAASAQRLADLRPLEAAPFTGIGVVNTSGPLGDAGCSGALIAPDLVLTAAHCAGEDDAVRWFMPGGLGPRARAAVKSSSTQLHPAYTEREGIARFAVDLALLRLETALPAEVARPLPMASPADYDADRFAIVAFTRQSPASVQGRFDCERLQGFPGGQMQLGCAVVSGNSGAPALMWGRSGWQVAGVTVGQLGKGEDGSALIAPLDTWLREITAVSLPQLR